MKEQHRGPVIVLAPRDAVVVFATTEELLHDLEQMDYGAGDRSRYFDLAGNELDLVQERGVTLIVRNRVRGTAPQAPEGELDEKALRIAADEVLRRVWESRFPRRPRWLHRLFHGQTPPNV